MTLWAPVLQMVQSLGFAIYRALDWGLDDSEERELSPQLERLIDLMANNDCEDSGCGAADEGYGGPEEEEEAEGGPRTVRTFAQAMRLCAARLTDPRGAQAHYQAVCRALFVETLELRAFLARVREAKEVSEQGCVKEGPRTWRGFLEAEEGKGGQGAEQGTRRWYAQVESKWKGSQVRGNRPPRYLPGHLPPPPPPCIGPSVSPAGGGNPQLRSLTSLALLSALRVGHYLRGFAGFPLTPTPTP